MRYRELVTDLLAWFAQNARPLPWRQTVDPYAVWVSEIMLQQTQVKTVVPYWNRWMAELPDIASLARAKPGRVHKLWEGLGYYSRVRNMQQAAKAIMSGHGGRFPENFESVLELPGIGRYTAGAICSIAFNQPRPILDGNVIRVLTRLLGVETNPREPKTNAKLWRIAEDLVVQVANSGVDSQPRSGQPATDNSTSSAAITSRISPPTTDDRRSKLPRCSHLNQALMELGALICTPRQPRCDACPISSLCVARRKGIASELPRLGPRARSTARHFIAFVVQKNGRLLVRQRPAGVVNAHLWELPNLEVTAPEGSANGKAPILSSAQELFGFKPKAFEEVCTINHSITRYRIRLDVFRISAAQSPKLRSDGCIWLRPTQLRRRPFTAASKRALEAVMHFYKQG
jgi:A/G-specific adenine glycosylase